MKNTLKNIYSNFKLFENRFGAASIFLLFFKARYFGLLGIILGATVGGIFYLINHKNDTIFYETKIETEIITKNEAIISIERVNLLFEKIFEVIEKEFKLNEVYFIYNKNSNIYSLYINSQNSFNLKDTEKTIALINKLSDSENNSLIKMNYTGQFKYIINPENFNDLLKLDQEFNRLKIIKFINNEIDKINTIQTDSTFKFKFKSIIIPPVKNENEYYIYLLNMHLNGKIDLNILNNKTKSFYDFKSQIPDDITINNQIKYLNNSMLPKIVELNSTFNSTKVVTESPIKLVPLIIGPSIMGFFIFVFIYYLKNILNRYKLFIQIRKTHKTSE